MTTTQSLSFLGVALLACAGLRADEVRLTDGRVFYGAVQDRGETLLVSTRDGQVSVPRDAVLRIRTEAELREELRGLAARCGPTSAFCCLHLAHTARDFGLTEELWTWLDKTLEQKQIPDAVRQRLDEFIATLEPELLPARWRKASATARAREIILRLRPEDPPARRLAAARVLAGLEGAGAELRTRARAATLPVQRCTANEAIWIAGTDEARHFVYRTAVLDAAPEVRDGAVRLIRGGNLGKAGTDYIAGALLHDNPHVRIRAADAVASIGDPSAAELLVKAAPLAAAPGEAGGVRAHAAFLTQQSYIRDFDVEVAQSSFIADPKVDALTYGSVIDVRVGAVTTTRLVIVEAFRRAVARLEGADPGPDPDAWARWLAARRNS